MKPGVVRLCARSRPRTSRCESWKAILAATMATASPAMLAAEPNDVPRDAAHKPASEPAVVLNLPRLPHADTLLLRTGERREGAWRLDAFRLRVAEDELVFPADEIAGVDFTDAASGLVVVVTRRHDRLSGFPGERVFSFDPAGSNAPVAVRAEDLLKLAVRRQPGEVAPQPSGVLAELRNGDFFSGELLSDPFCVEAGGAALRWASGEIAAASFSSAQPARVELVLTNGRTLTANLMATDLEFQMAAGPRRRIHASRLERLRRVAAWPPELLARIGVGGGARPEAGLPDPAVTPAGDLVWIPPGEFTMGSPPEEKDRDLDEGPLTRVVFPAGFWIGRHEVTQAAFEALMGANPSRYAGHGQLPVERVTWFEAVEYCRRLTERERAAGRLPETHTYRLPTEAEWEYACRAGTHSRFSHGDDPAATALPDYGWFGDNSDSTPQQVGTRKPNPWGLHDMHGNVLEWCLDTWRGNLPGGMVTNRVTLPEGTLRVARGGSWLYPARTCRSANRDSYGVLNRCSDLGFRVVLARVPEP
jgi:formylglycine-generating enzyme required for sulfatase activity